MLHHKLINSVLSENRVLRVASIDKFGLGALLSVALILFSSPCFSQSRGIAIEPTTAKAQTPYVPGRYRALIIGNDEYKDPTGRWFSLNTAVADANALETMLKTNYGFSDITKLTNASRRDIVLAISDLSKRVLPNDSVLVFYAGHGYLDQDSNKGFWVPVDANGTDHTTYLRNSTIRDELSTIASRSKHTLLVADSCFSGTLLRRGINPLSVANANEAYFRKVANKKSAQIITSGGIEFVDDDYKKSGHSPFTYFLLNELKYNDKPMLTVSELSSNVTKAVSNNVEQTPNSGVLAEAGDELGEFIFIKLKVKVDTKGIPLDKVKVEVELEPMDEQAPKQELRKTVEQPPVSDSPTVTKNESKPKANKSQDDVIYHIPSL